MGILCSTTTREVAGFFVQEGTNQGSWLRLTGVVEGSAGRWETDQLPLQGKSIKTVLCGRDPRPLSSHLL